MKLILASTSQWRQELISWLNLPFQIISSDFDESNVNCQDPGELVSTLAVKKAQAVVEKILTNPLSSGLEKKTYHKEHEPITNSETSLIVGADTVIVTNNNNPFGDQNIDIIGKPKDINHAREILLRLKNKAHFVYTGISVINSDTLEKVVEVEVTKVTFRDFSDQEIDQYLKTGESIGKAGAYQMLGEAMKLVEAIEGSLTGVVGLPLKTTSSMLEEMGLVVPINTREVVIAKTGYPD